MANQITTPPYLKTGDTIGIVSTASKIDQKDVEPAVSLLQNLGYKVFLGKSVFAQFHQFAGRDMERTLDLQHMLDNPDVKAIICSRGGYGSIRTLQNINWNTFLKFPKWIVGFSDVTTLHSQLNQLDVASIHGVMPKFFLKNNTASESFKTLHNALLGEKQTYTLKSSKYNKTGKAKGDLVGGNLSILYSLRGTPYDINTSGKLLFIEDLAEYKYHLDRMMMNFKTGGLFKGLNGLIVGSFTGMKDNDTPFGKTVEEIILDAISEYNFPVIFDFPAGHQEQNMALKMGCNAEILVDEKSVVVSQ